MRPTRYGTRADGTHLRHRSISGLGWQTVVGQHFRRHPSGRLAEKITMWDEQHNRKRGPVQADARSASCRNQNVVSVEANAAQRRYAGTKPDVVVTVVGVVVVAVGRAAIPRIVVPRPAAQHAGHVSGSPAGRSLHVQHAPLQAIPPRKNSRAAARRDSEQQTSSPVISSAAPSYSMGDEQHNRKPMPLRRRSGTKSRRKATRQRLGE